MKNNELDQYLQDRLLHAEVPPPAFVWAQVERQLRERRSEHYINRLCPVMEEIFGMQERIFSEQKMMHAIPIIARAGR